MGNFDKAPTQDAPQSGVEGDVHMEGALDPEVLHSICFDAIEKVYGGIPAEDKQVEIAQAFEDFVDAEVDKGRVTYDVAGINKLAAQFAEKEVKLSDAQLHAHETAPEEELVAETQGDADTQASRDAALAQSQLSEAELVEKQAAQLLESIKNSGTESVSDETDDSTDDAQKVAQETPKQGEDENMTESVEEEQPPRTPLTETPTSTLYKSAFTPTFHANLQEQGVNRDKVAQIILELTRSFDKVVQKQEEKNPTPEEIATMWDQYTEEKLHVGDEDSVERKMYSALTGTVRSDASEKNAEREPTQPLDELFAEVFSSEAMMTLREDHPDDGRQIEEEIKLAKEGFASVIDQVLQRKNSNRVGTIDALRGPWHNYLEGKQNKAAEGTLQKKVLKALYSDQRKALGLGKKSQSHNQKKGETSTIGTAAEHVETTPPTIEHVQTWEELDTWISDLPNGELQGQRKLFSADNLRQIVVKIRDKKATELSLPRGSYGLRTKVKELINAEAAQSGSEEKKENSPANEDIVSADASVIDEAQEGEEEKEGEKDGEKEGEDISEEEDNISPDEIKKNIEKNDSASELMATVGGEEFAGADDSTNSVEAKESKENKEGKDAVPGVSVTLQKEEFTGANDFTSQLETMKGPENIPAPENGQPKESLGEINEGFEEAVAQQDENSEQEGKNILQLARLMKSARDKYVAKEIEWSSARKRLRGIRSEEVSKKMEAELGEYQKNYDDARKTYFDAVVQSKGERGEMEEKDIEAILRQVNVKEFVRLDDVRGKERIKQFPWQERARRAVNIMVGGYRRIPAKYKLAAAGALMIGSGGIAGIGAASVWGAAALGTAGASMRVFGSAAAYTGFKEWMDDKAHVKQEKEFASETSEKKDAINATLHESGEATAQERAAVLRSLLARDIDQTKKKIDALQLSDDQRRLLAMGGTAGMLLAGNMIGSAIGDYFSGDEVVADGATMTEPAQMIGDTVPEAPSADVVRPLEGDSAWTTTDAAAGVAPESASVAEVIDGTYNSSEDIGAAVAKEEIMDAVDAEESIIAKEEILDAVAAEDAAVAALEDAEAIAGVEGISTDGEYKPQTLENSIDQVARAEVSDALIADSDGHVTLDESNANAMNAEIASTESGIDKSLYTEAKIEIVKGDSLSSVITANEELRTALFNEVAGEGSTAFNDDITKAAYQKLAEHAARVAADMPDMTPQQVLAAYDNIQPGETLNVSIQPDGTWDFSGSAIENIQDGPLRGSGPDIARVAVDADPSVNPNAGLTGAGIGDNVGPGLAADAKGAGLRPAPPLGSFAEAMQNPPEGYNPEQTETGRLQGEFQKKFEEYTQNKEFKSNYAVGDMRAKVTHIFGTDLDREQYETLLGRTTMGDLMNTSDDSVWAGSPEQAAMQKFVDQVEDVLGSSDTAPNPETKVGNYIARIDMFAQMTGHGAEYDLLGYNNHLATESIQQYLGAYHDVAAHYESLNASEKAVFLDQLDIKNPEDFTSEKFSDAIQHMDGPTLYGFYDMLDDTSKMSMLDTLGFVNHDAVQEQFVAMLDAQQGSDGVSGQDLMGRNAETVYNSASSAKADESVAQFQRFVARSSDVFGEIYGQPMGTESVDDYMMRMAVAAQSKGDAAFERVFKWKFNVI